MMSIPEKASEIIKKHINLIEGRLPSLLEAYYIYGSISLGEFDDGMSDIDFIAVMKTAPTKSEIVIFKEIHRHMKQKFPKIDLMGLYVTKADFQTHNDNLKTCPCFLNGKYEGLKFFDKNSIDAHQLKKYGITIIQERKNLK